MNSINSLAYDENKQIQSVAAHSLIRQHEKSNLSCAKYMAIAGVVTLILLAGTLVAGKYVYVEFIGDIKMSIGSLGGMFLASGLAVFCVGSVAHYLLGRKAKEQFSKPFSEIDSVFKQRLIKDLNLNIGFYRRFKEYYDKKGFQNQSQNEEGKIQDAQSVLDQLQSNQESYLQSSQDEVKKKKMTSILQISTMILATLLAMGGIGLWMHAVGQSNVLEHSFSKFDALSLVGSTSFPLVLGTGVFLCVLLQDKKKRFDPEKFSSF